MSGFTCLWVDDVRPIPEDFDCTQWCSARSFHEAILKLELLQFTTISLDHDLGSYYGNKEMTGNDVLNWLIERKMAGHYVPGEIKVHSANPVGAQRMRESIARYWRK